MLDGRGILEAVPIGDGMQIGEKIFCLARKKLAGILAAFQDFLPRQGGKIPGQTAFNACEYRF